MNNYITSITGKFLAIIIIFMINIDIFAMDNSKEKINTEIVQIAGGLYHNLMLRTDGSVWSWGNGESGQLGNGEMLSYSHPVRVLIDIPISQIAAGQRHSLILGVNRQVYGFGSNKYGQINKNDPIIKQLTPIPIPNLSDILLIADGGNHSLALKADNSVLARGKNDFGQCGKPPTHNKKQLPTIVDTGLKKIIGLAAGDHHSLALLEDGIVIAWGANIHGQLGNGTWINYSSDPVKVENLTKIVSIAAGGEHSIALRSDGTVWTWGRNHACQLGNGQKLDQNLPAQVLGLPKIISIEGEGPFTILLDVDHNLWGFGCNRYGQIGTDCKSKIKELPVKIDTLQYIVSFTTGHFHTIALDQNGLVWGFGRNNYGQLGDGSFLNRCPPVKSTCANESNFLSICY